jgi:hypothetical protein
MIALLRYALFTGVLLAGSPSAALPPELKQEVMIHCNFAQKGSFDLKASDGVAFYFAVGVIGSGKQFMEIHDPARVLAGDTVDIARVESQTIALHSESNSPGHLVIVHFNEPDAMMSYPATVGYLGDSDGSELRFGRCLLFSGSDAQKVLKNYRDLKSGIDTK